MTPLPAGFLNGHTWLGRLGHFSRRGVPILGVAILAVAVVVILRAAAAARENLAFDPGPYRAAAEQLEERAGAIAHDLTTMSAEELLARYERPKPPPPPPPTNVAEVVQVEAPPPPAPTDVLKSWRLRGVLEQGGNPVAVLNQSLVSVGDELEGFVVQAIAETYVELRDKEGRSHRLDLYDHLPGRVPATAPLQP